MLEGMNPEQRRLCWCLFILVLPPSEIIFGRVNILCTAVCTVTQGSARARMAPRAGLRCPQINDWDEKTSQPEWGPAGEKNAVPRGMTLFTDGHQDNGREIGHRWGWDPDLIYGSLVGGLRWGPTHGSWQLRMDEKWACRMNCIVTCCMHCDLDLFRYESCQVISGNRIGGRKAFPCCEKLVM